MKLHDYLKKEGETRRSFAQKAGISRAMVSHIATGRATPSIETALRIQEATGGEVTAKDLIPDHPAWKLLEQKEAVA